MANYVNKVVYGNETLIDLTADTVTADKLAKGYTAHSRTGELITGTMETHILIGMMITTPPTKTRYSAGETLDVSGIVVEAIYIDGDNVDITSECTFSPAQGTVLYEDTDSILIGWKTGGSTNYATQKIEVARTLSSIAITQPPTKTKYELNEALDLSGMIITAIYNSGATAVVTGYTTDPVAGYVFTKNEQINLRINYSENGITKTATVVISAGLADWSTGTDEEIVAMVNAADAGALKLSDYWKVGQERTVSLPAMEATNVGETHAAQEVTLVLLNAGGKTLANGKECNFIVGLKDCLNEEGYMNPTDTNEGSWEDSARRKWCNNEFKTAMLSTGIGSIFKQHQNITAKTYNGTDPDNWQQSTDWFALAAGKEAFGNTYKAANSNPIEAAKLTQFSYYTSGIHSVKKADGSAASWWLRSPYAGTEYPEYFSMGSFVGTTTQGEASGNGGLSPFGCI